MIRSRSSRRDRALSSYISLPVFCGLGSIFLSVFAAVSFLSFDPHDPSWFYFSSEISTVHNAAGFLGAHVAAFCFYILGHVAFLILPLLVFIGWHLIKQNSLITEWDRLLASCIALLCLAGIFYGHQVGAKPYMVAGGSLGQWFYVLFLPTFERIGTLALFYSAFFSCVLVVTRMHCITMLRGIKGAGQYLFEYRHLWLIPCVRAFQFVVYGFVSACAWVVKRLWTTVMRGEVEDSQKAAVAFEHAGNGLSQESESQFWNEYIQRRSHGGVMQAPHDGHKAVSFDAPSAPVKQAGLVQPKSTVTRKNYSAPSPALFGVSDKESYGASGSENKQLAATLEEKLERFGVSGRVVTIKPGPVITLFEYQPEIDAKVSKILALEHDLAMALEAMSVRIVAPIPGTNKVGFEVANKERKSVRMGDIMRSSAFVRTKAVLPLVLGQDTTGENVVVDLLDMPHLLVAGSTGSGKSVALNTMLSSLLCKLSPQELKLIIIDPKRLEFAAMHDIAHLLFPVITEARRAAPVIRWLVRVMEERYEMMAAQGARSILDYKKMCREKNEQDELPFIVLIIDELADLMMVAGRDIEDSIARLAQMARAAGIHLIVATQRPSVDVITGVIKVNFPSRISFRVTSKIDSRTILDTGGAENLLGKGDMLFMDAQSARMRRIHGAYVSDAEINAVANHIRAQEKVVYTDLQEAIAAYKTEEEMADEPLLPEVLSFLATVDEISISSLQRRFKIGYNRSARLMELLEAQGKIMPASGSKMRKVIH